MSAMDMENRRNQRRLSASKFLLSCSKDDDDTIFSDYKRRRNVTVPCSSYMKKDQCSNGGKLNGHTLSFARSKPEAKSQPTTPTKYGFLQGCRKLSCIGRMNTTDNDMLNPKTNKRDMSGPPHYQNTRFDSKEKKKGGSFNLRDTTSHSFTGNGHDNACYRSSTDNYSLAKQLDDSNCDNDYEELANLELFSNKKSQRKCESVRICPVLQNGQQMSNTHYWILANRKCRQFHSNPDSENALDFVSSHVQNKQSLSVDNGCIHDAKNDYMNINNDSANVYHPSPFLSAESCISRNYSDLQVPVHSPSNKVKNKMIEVLGNEVPQATRKECEAVLIGQSWNYNVAIQRLKLDILCRHVKLSRKELKSVLVANQWDLTDAIEYVCKLREAERRLKETHATEKRYNSCSPDHYTNFAVMNNVYPFDSRRSRSIRHLSSISRESLNSGVQFLS